MTSLQTLPAKRNTMAKLLMRVSADLPCKIIKDGNQPYLERYYLCTLMNSRVYLHRFVASDPDRGYHDHPWRWALSFILVGFYYELNSYGRSTVRWINGLVGDSEHRVILPPEISEVWTLFIHHAPRSKGWGFYRVEEGIGTVYTEHKPSETEPEDWWTTALPGRFHSERQV